jgi:hypothetical protein
LGKPLRNVGAPTVDAGASTKKYVDDTISATETYADDAIGSAIAVTKEYAEGVNAMIPDSYLFEVNARGIGVINVKHGTTSVDPGESMEINLNIKGLFLRPLVNNTLPTGLKLGGMTIVATLYAIFFVQKYETVRKYEVAGDDNKVETTDQDFYPSHVTVNDFFPAAVKISISYNVRREDKSMVKTYHYGSHVFTFSNYFPAWEEEEKSAMI